jgi:alanyl-tRNA synthetase
VDQPYVLRRILRRSILKGSELGIKGHFLSEIAGTVVANYSDVYPELKRNEEQIYTEIKLEEEQFAKTLERGIKEFYKLISRVPEHVRKKVISGKNAFKLYDTYGLPLEVTVEMAEKEGFEVDKEGFRKAFEKHQELSRKGAEQKFKGGLAEIRKRQQHFIRQLTFFIRL